MRVLPFLLILISCYPQKSTKEIPCYTTFNKEKWAGYVHVSSNKDVMWENRNRIYVSKNQCTGDSFDAVYLSSYVVLYEQNGEFLVGGQSEDGTFPKDVELALRRASRGDQFHFEKIKVVIDSVECTLPPMVWMITKEDYIK